MARRRGAEGFQVRVEALGVCYCFRADIVLSTVCQYHGIVFRGRGLDAYCAGSRPGIVMSSRLKFVGPDWAEVSGCYDRYDAVAELTI